MYLRRSRFYEVDCNLVFLCKIVLTASVYLFIYLFDIYLFYLFIYLFITIYGTL